jgi:hypothetical protein
MIESIVNTFVGDGGWIGLGIPVIVHRTVLIRCIVFLGAAFLLVEDEFVECGDLVVGFLSELRLVGPHRQHQKKVDFDVDWKLVIGVFGDMADRGAGGILNVASTAAWFPGPFMTIYYASKAYLKGFSEGIARELEPEGASVMVLCLGPAETEFQERAENEDTPLGSGEMQDVEMVAEAGYEGLQAGKTVVVTGWTLKLLTKVSNILPNRLTSRIATDLNTPE